MSPYFPAISLMAFMLLLFLVVSFKVSQQQLDRFASAGNALLLSAILLFALTVIAHLFLPQDWTADLLKVIAGIIVGAGAGAASNASAVQVAQGSQIQQAGRDLIQEMKGGIEELKDSVVNQYASVQKIEQKVFDLKRQGEHPNPAVVIGRLRVELYDDDPDFLERMDAIDHRSAYWVVESFNVCYRNPRIKRHLHQTFESLQRSGYRVLSISPVEVVSNGMYCHMEIAREVR